MPEGLCPSLPENLRFSLEPGTALASAVPARLGRREVRVLCGAGLKGAAVRAA